MLSEICAYLRNWFSSDADRHQGTFEISGGSITPPADFLQEGQYFRVIGSTFNDGVHRYPAGDLTDEMFTGAVWAMRVPPDFLALVEQIRQYAESDAGKPSAFVSESFGGYSYSKATGQNGAPAGWQDVFSFQLRKYKKVRA